MRAAMFFLFFFLIEPRLFFIMIYLAKTPIRARNRRADFRRSLKVEIRSVDVKCFPSSAMDHSI